MACERFRSIEFISQTSIHSILKDRVTTLPESCLSKNPCQLQKGEERYCARNSIHHLEVISFIPAQISLALFTTNDA